MVRWWWSQTDHFLDALSINSERSIPASLHWIFYELLQSLSLKVTRQLIEMRNRASKNSRFSDRRLSCHLYFFRNQSIKASNETRRKLWNEKHNSIRRSWYFDQFWTWFSVGAMKWRDRVSARATSWFWFSDFYPVHTRSSIMNEKWDENIVKHEIKTHKIERLSLHRSNAKLPHLLTHLRPSSIDVREC